MLRKSVQKAGAAGKTAAPLAPVRSAPEVTAPAPSVPPGPAGGGLGREARLDYTVSFPFLGVPVELYSNSAPVIAAADRSFAAWRRLEPERVEQVRPLSLKLIVHPGQRMQIKPGGFVYRAYGDCFLAAAESNILTAQVDRGEALAFVTPELVAAELTFRRQVLECLAELLVGRHDRTPLQAAAIVRNGRTVVLAGPSGSGKSTLCYAAVKDGFQLLAEETVFVSMERGLRLWGAPWHLHMPSDAPRYFPELADIPAVLQPSGKLKVPVPVERLGSDRAIPCAGKPIVCLLQRQRRTRSSVEDIPARQVIEELTRPGEPVIDFNPRAAEVAARLTGDGAYRFLLGTDVAGAVKQLGALTAE
jgi:hypothetical protein